jgi:hypothetical protein
MISPEKQDVVQGVIWCATVIMFLVKICLNLLVIHLMLVELRAKLEG